MDVKNEKKVSVIIPVYNVEKYLRQCLDSVVNQTLTDIEIICVDDGSTDNSREIIASYQKRDDRIRLLTQCNKYAGVARNLGMQKACGKYLLFLDADDVFLPQMIERLVSRAENTEADVCLCGADRFDTNTGEHTPSPWLLRKMFLPRKDVFSRKDVRRLFQITSPAPWNKLFLRSFVNRWSLEFQSLKRTNDLYFTMAALALAERISWVSDVLVHYRTGMNDNLQSRNNETPLCFCDALEHLRFQLEKFGVFDRVRLSYADLALSVTAHNLRSLNDEVSRDAKKVIGDRYFDCLCFGMFGAEKYTNLENYNYIRAQFKSLWESDRRGVKVSVVVPVYNVEKYLSECLDSVENQTLRDIEIICINDGSTDASLRILEEHQMNDNRIVVISQQNAGLGAARNAGLRRAHGKYVYFLDSDDAIVPYALQELCDLAERECLDQIIFAAETFSDDGEVQKRVIRRFRKYYCLSQKCCNKTMTGDRLLLAMMDSDSFPVSQPLRFFRREYLNKAGLRYPVGIFHEDIAFAYVSLMAAKRARAVNKPYFRRRVRIGSITQSTANYQKRYDGIMKNVTYLLSCPPLWAGSRHFSTTMTNVVLRLIRSSDQFAGERAILDICDSIDDLKLSSFTYIGGLGMRIRQCLYENGIGYTIRHGWAKISHRFMQ